MLPLPVKQNKNYFKVIIRSREETLTSERSTSSNRYRVDYEARVWTELKSAWKYIPK